MKKSRAFSWFYILYKILSILTCTQTIQKNDCESSKSVRGQKCRFYNLEATAFDGVRWGGGGSGENSLL